MATANTSKKFLHSSNTEAWQCNANLWKSVYTKMAKRNYMSSPRHLGKSRLRALVNQ